MRYLQTLSRYYQVTDTSTSKCNPLTVVVVLECHMSIQKHRVVSVAYRTFDGVVAR